MSSSAMLQVILSIYGQITTGDHEYTNIVAVYSELLWPVNTSVLCGLVNLDTYHLCNNTAYSYVWDGHKYITIYSAVQHLFFHL